DAAGVTAYAIRIEDIGSSDLADGDAAGDLARKHDEVAHLDGVHELIELRREVADLVLARAWVRSGDRLRDGVARGKSSQVADLAEAQHQPAVGDGVQLALAAAARADNPQPRHAASAWAAAARTSILPVTAAEIRAARRSIRRMAAASASLIKPSSVLTWPSMNA